MNIFKRLFKNKSEPEVNESIKQKKENHFSIVSDKIDPVRGIELKLDWDDDFIRYLRANGYHGASDEIVVQKWLHATSLSLEERLKLESDFTSDFE